MSDSPQLREWIETHYEFEQVTLEAVSEGLDQSKQNYYVLSRGQCVAVLTAYSPDSTPSDLGALVEVLLALQQKDYPAEQIIPAEDGEPVLEVNGWRLLLKTYVDGFPVQPDVPTFRRVGALLGRLHTAFSGVELHELPEAERTMTRQVAQTRAQLDTVRGQLPETHASLWQAVDAALMQLQPCDTLPEALIHNDFHLTNIYNSHANELKVIDWDGAGRGPALTDLGFLLSAAHPRPQNSESTRPDPARIEAIVTGYGQHRRLSEDELDCLADSVRLRVLERLASNLVMQAEQGEQDVEHPWWLARFASADETARLARDAFGRLK
jgi:Ser/Thr protein kinase RdoA (MazF antagonist)